MNSQALPGGFQASCAPPRSRGRSKLRRVLTWAVVLLLSLVLLVVVLIVFRNPLLRAVTEYNITSQTGLEAEIGGLNVGLGSASLSITEFLLANPPGFGDAPFLRVPELYIKLDPAHSLDSTIAFEEIRFHLATLNIVKDQSGQYNFDAITNTPAQQRGRKRDRDNAPSFGGIERLSLSVGTLSYTDLGKPELSTEVHIDLHAEASQLRSAQDLTNWVGGLITRVALQQYFKEASRDRALWKQLLQAP